MKKENMKELIQELEEKLLDSDVRRSVSDLDALLADTFFEIAGSGQTYDKTQMVKALMIEPSVVKWSLSNFHVRLLAKRIVLATYTASREEYLGAKPSLSIRSSLWELINDQWQMIYHQGTPVSK